MGDEGKGRLIPELIRELNNSNSGSTSVEIVVKVNGGANSGHTSGGLKLNLFPAGVVEKEVPILGIASGVVADPHKFIWEAAYIESHGFPVNQRLLIDERAMVSDLSHRLLDLAFESYRTRILGEPKRGSTGRGISPAYTDETGHFPIHYGVFKGDREFFERQMTARLNRSCRSIETVCRVQPEEWDTFFEILTAAETRANAEIMEKGLIDPNQFNFERFKGDRPFQLDVEKIVAAYWEAGTRLASQIGDLRQATIAALQSGKVVIGEFGQAFWLDKRHGFPPNVTASHTLPAEFFLSTGVPLQPAHTFGVCKAYDTKVGTHIFACEFPADHPLGRQLSLLEYGTTTGRQRMVGWFDAVEKGDAIRFGGADDLVINKLDALTYRGDWQSPEPLKICTAYALPDGTVLRHVPRTNDLHRQIRPIYSELPGWTEDISKIRTFDNLPRNAKRYIATALKATFEVAFDGLIDPEFPNLRYIGVGPDPDQVIRAIPPVSQLMELADS